MPLIAFYSAREQPYGCFSNFSPHGVTLDGLWWPTTEHYFQAQKFVGMGYAETIRLAPTAKRAAELGRIRAVPLRPDWEQIKDDVMLRAVRQKFTQHADIRAILLGTGDAEIVENAPGDWYWGCGKDGAGRNQLGLTLMRVRQELRAGS
jgi:ribA/ribD-fused uncharacterized protein